MFFVMSEFTSSPCFFRWWSCTSDSTWRIAVECSITSFPLQTLTAALQAAAFSIHPPTEPDPFEHDPADTNLAQTGHPVALPMSLSEFVGKLPCSAATPYVKSTPGGFVFVMDKCSVCVMASCCVEVYSGSESAQLMCQLAFECTAANCDRLRALYVEKGFVNARSDWLSAIPDVFSAEARNEM